MSEKTTIENEQVNKVKVKTRRSILVSFFMGTITLGVWNRFFPISKNKKGTWGPSCILLAFISAIFFLYLSGGSFYKELNIEIQKKLNIEEDIIPTKIGYSQENKSMGDIYSLKNKQLLLESAKYKEENKYLVIQVEELTKNINEISALKDAKIIELKNSIEKINAKRPNISLVSYEEIEKEVGCSSLYSEQKRIDKFNEKYANKWVKWSGKVSSSTNDKVTVNKLANQSGFSVDFFTPGEGYSLIVNDDITLSFKLTTQGNCSEPFKGTDAISE